jgi:hypothetical protein
VRNDTTASGYWTFNLLVLMPAAAALVTEPFPALLAVAAYVEQVCGLDVRVGGI